MAAFYRFKLGDFMCVCVSDGGMNYPVYSMFKDIPLDKAESMLRQHGLPTTHVYTPYTLLYVDTGIGSYGNHAKVMWPQVDNSGLEAGICLQSLRQAGIRPEDIDTVIITHAHPDHIGGNLSETGELNLPNAEYFIGQVEWDFWLSSHHPENVLLSFVETARYNLAPLHERITCIEADTAIVPGITSVAAPGHTPGHIALSIASNGEHLLHISDAVIHPIHLIYPDLLLPFDILPKETLASKRRLCDRAASEGTLVFAQHFPPYPNLGHIVRQGASWNWQPHATATT